MFIFGWGLEFGVLRIGWIVVRIYRVFRRLLELAGMEFEKRVIYFSWSKVFFVFSYSL